MTTTMMAMTMLAANDVYDNDDDDDDDDDNDARKCLHLHHSSLLVLHSPTLRYYAVWVVQFSTVQDRSVGQKASSYELK
jgi:hypothetical protein